MLNRILGVITVIVLAIGAVAYFSDSRERSGRTGPPAQAPMEAPRMAEVRLEDGDTYRLTAAPHSWRVGGAVVDGFAYNGSVPGPVLRVRQGSAVTIELENRMGEPTTAHWHGVRVANAYDGVPDVTQEPVPSGETFAYQVEFPDAGAFWYHPHVREDKQQELGLYGLIVVEPADAAPAPRSEILIVDDILLAGGRSYPFQPDIVDHALMGRFGNAMAVNGADTAVFDAAQGETVRFIVLNAANARPFNVVFPGAAMVAVGSDGGSFERPQETDGVLLGPSERAVIDVTFPERGDYRIEHRTPDRAYALGTVRVSGDGAAAARLDAEDPTLAAARLRLGKDVDAVWRLDVETAHMMHHASSGGPIEWEDDMGMMNLHMSDLTTEWKIVDEATGRANLAFRPSWKKGDFVKIRLINDSSSDHPMQHPIHLHGQRFVVAAVDGEPNDNLAWKDTVLVPSGSKVDILVEMSNPGAWMAHCHVPEHMESGMMTVFDVAEG